MDENNQEDEKGQAQAVEATAGILLWEIFRAVFVYIVLYFFKPMWETTVEKCKKMWNKDEGGDAETPPPPEV